MKKIIALVTALLVIFAMSVTVANASGKTAECTPKAAYTEVVKHPAVTHTVTDTVVDAAAYDEVVAPAVEAQHYSLKGNSGIGKDEVPVFPADYWQANTHQEPHGSDNVTWLNADHTGLHYTSHGSEGLRDWFYFAPATPAVVVHHDAVTHEVVRTVVDQLETTDVITHEAVTCATIDDKPVVKHHVTYEPAPVPTTKPKHVVTPTLVHAGF